MPFSLENKLNDSRLKKKPIIKRFPILVPLFVFILILIGYSLLNKTTSTPLIGVIPINGVILESESVIKKIRLLENNPLVQGIIIRINSPGGAVSPSQEILTELIRLKKKKKVYASISSIAASGGYYIAIGADKIFANPGSLTGSIGVIMQTFNVEKLMNKIGVRMETIKSGKNKDIGSAFRKMTDKERELLQTVISDTHEQFVEAISVNRKIDKKKIRRLADGRIFTGRLALQHNLIDGLASFRQTVDKIKIDLGIQEQIKLFYPPDKKETLLSILELESLFRLKETFIYSGLFYLGDLFKI